MSEKFNYGGQAVLEGVMMRGSRSVAVAVRAPEGEIVVQEEPINSALYNGIWSKIPFIRGLGLLWDSLGLGMRALTFSADVAVGDEAEFGGPVAWGTMIISIGIAIGLFFLLPAAVADGLQTLLDSGEPAVVSPVDEQVVQEQEIVESATDDNVAEASDNSIRGIMASSLAGNLVEGVIRLSLAIGYIWAIGFMPEIGSVFAYHGAEHKTINAYEDGALLTPESVARYPSAHPRCGTGFLLVVMVISVLLFSILGRPPLLIRLASRVVLIPVIAGISYEYIPLLARFIDNPIARFLVMPQLALQRLTTREPSPDMLEVSIVALKRVLAVEQLPVPASEPASAETRK